MHICNASPRFRLPLQPIWVDAKYVSQEVAEDFESGLEYAQVRGWAVPQGFVSCIEAGVRAGARLCRFAGLCELRASCWWRTHGCNHDGSVGACRCGCRGRMMLRC